MSKQFEVARKYGASAFLVYSVIQSETFVTINKIASITNLSVKTVSKTLAILEAEDIVSCRLTTNQRKEFETTKNEATHVCLEAIQS